MSLEDRLFPLTLENGAALERMGALERYVACTMAEPWALV